MARTHRGRRAQKRRKKKGSSVAIGTIGTFLSQINGTPRHPGDRTPTCLQSRDSTQNAGTTALMSSDMHAASSIPALREQH